MENKITEHIGAIEMPSPSWPHYFRTNYSSIDPSNKGKNVNEIGYAIELRSSDKLCVISLSVRTAHDLNARFGILATSACQSSG